ncbi:Deoxycytidine monophosphate (dCMP) deaminase [Coemansia sp. RSA 2703]|nr:Deoxycytidine monophosphate (dCMP) deaminase [Coemansia sp. RSA 2703]KAJ2374598.1 Deoxycytidine monophosphate (dCMP) deaminase [Coemansia sp. RSA 2607]KAJ2396954.1 Deoxycytidine monophosphate (dCMP) deaminase [Coemansia sp. RSA 2603]
MFISVIGSKSSGKEEVANYLVRCMGFTRIRLARQSNARTDTAKDSGAEPTELTFKTTKQILEYITPLWRTNFVTTDVTSPIDLYLLWKRPFVLVVGIDAPTGIRYRRYCIKQEANNMQPLSLEQFVDIDDSIMYSCQSPPMGAHNIDTISLGMAAAALADNSKDPLVADIALRAESEPQPLLSPIIRNASDAHELNLKRVLSSANVSIANTFPTREDLFQYLDKIDLTNGERIRPSWDTYFMLLSELASHRANCMKRKVGCILVKDNQIIATGYNGTPKGITNCNEGGCPRCNDGTPCGVSLDHCLCIHAEENALLEAGRGRVRNAEGVVLYCNTCPCLGCAKKIVQVGVKVVVYSKGYGMDKLTLKLFKEANIAVRQHTPPTLSMEIGSP